MEIYGAAVADKLDNGRNILGRRYYRQHCTPDFGSYTKDLSAICNDLNRVSLHNYLQLTWVHNNHFYFVSSHYLQYIHIDIHHRQFTRSISLLPKQCHTNQIMVLWSNGHLFAVIITIIGCVTFHKWCSICAVTKFTFASSMVACLIRYSYTYTYTHNNNNWYKYILYMKEINTTKQKPTNTNRIKLNIKYINKYLIIDRIKEIKWNETDHYIIKILHDAWLINDIID